MTAALITAIVTTFNLAGPTNLLMVVVAVVTGFLGGYVLADTLPPARNLTRRRR